MTQLSDIVGVLLEYGYKDSGTAVESRDARVTFDCVLSDGYASGDLLLVQFEQDSLLRDSKRKLKQLHLLLTRAESLRSFTIIPCAPAVDPGSIGELERYARVVPVIFSENAATQLTNLRPLWIPDPKAYSSSIVDRMRNDLSNSKNTKFARRLIKNAEKSSEAVERVFLEEIREAISDASDKK